MPPLVYSVPQAAEVLGISDTLAYRLVHRGELPSVRLGDRRLVVPHRALEAWLLAQAGIGEPAEPEPVLDDADVETLARWSARPAT